MNKIKILIALIFISITSYAQDCDLNEDAQRYLVRANAAIKDAKNETDFLKAIVEFKKAIEYAPNCPDIYHDIAICYDKSASLGLLKDTWACSQAIIYYKKYLALKPTAQDKQTVQNKIYEIEYKYDNLNAKLQKIIGKFGGSYDDFIDLDDGPWGLFIYNSFYFEIKLGDNNQFSVSLPIKKSVQNKKDVRYREWTEFGTFPVENYIDENGTEYLKFCVENLKIVLPYFPYGSEKTPKHAYTCSFDCCFFLKYENDKFILKFQPRNMYNRSHKNSDHNVILNDDNSKYNNKIFQGEIKKTE